MYVYGAVIMTQVISRVHPVHLINVEQRQAAVDLDQANQPVL